MILTCSSHVAASTCTFWLVELMVSWKLLAQSFRTRISLPFLAKLHQKWIYWQDLSQGMHIKQAFLIWLNLNLKNTVSAWVICSMNEWNAPPACSRPTVCSHLSWFISSIILSWSLCSFKRLSNWKDADRWTLLSKSLYKTWCIRQTLCDNAVYFVGNKVQHFCQANRIKLSSVSEYHSLASVVAECFKTFISSSFCLNHCVSINASLSARALTTKGSVEGVVANPWLMRCSVDATGLRQALHR